MNRSPMGIFGIKAYRYVGSLGDFKRRLLLVGNFAVARALVYFSPFLIAILVEPEAYGVIELSQAIGLLAAGLIATAPLSGVTQRYLVGSLRYFWDIVSFTVFLGGALGLAVSAICLSLGANTTTIFVSAVLPLAVVHNTVSAISRTMGLKIITAWSDGFYILFTTLVILVIFLMQNRVAIDDISPPFVLFSAALTLISGLAFLRLKRDGFVSRLKAVVGIGLPIAVVSMMSIWLGVSGRVTIGIFTESSLPAFAMAFRVAGLSLALQQLSTVILFVRLYTSRTKQSDAILGIIYSSVLCLLVLICLVGPYLPMIVDIRALSGIGQETYRQLLPLASLQVFFWIGYAMLEMRINRYRLSARAIGPMCAVFVSGGCLIAGVGFFLAAGPLLLCWLTAFHTAAFFGVNVIVLARRGVPHRRVTWVGVIGGSALSGIAVLYTVFI